MPPNTPQEHPQESPRTPPGLSEDHPRNTVEKSQEHTRSTQGHHKNTLGMNRQGSPEEHPSNHKIRLIYATESEKYMRQNLRNTEEEETLSRSRHLLPALSRLTHPAPCVRYIGHQCSKYLIRIKEKAKNASTSTKG